MINRHAWLALLLTIPLALAGCLSSDSIDAASAQPQAVEASPKPADDAPMAPPGMRAEQVTIAESGSTETGAFACAPVPTMWTTFCYGVTRSGGSYFETDLTGTLDAVELTLTWDAPTPATETLILGLAYDNGDSSDWVYVAGKSPLVLRESGLGIAGADVLGVFVSAHRCAGTDLNVSGCASLEQPFELSGTLTLLHEE